MRPPPKGQKENCPGSHPAGAELPPLRRGGESEALHRPRQTAPPIEVSPRLRMIASIQGGDYTPGTAEYEATISSGSR